MIANPPQRTVNTLNCDCVTQVLDYVKASPYIKSISFNFHTPFPGTESLTLPQDKREEVIDTIIRYKKKGYPVMNTKAGLTRMKRLKFKKRCWITNYVHPTARSTRYRYAAKRAAANNAASRWRARWTPCSIFAPRPSSPAST